MALSASTVWECRLAGSGSSDTNGGGYVTGSSGTDWSQQDGPKYSLTNGSATTGNATINTVSASADMVGNIAYISGGTGSIVGGWYQIISQVTGTSITVDRSTGLVTGTGVNITIGGALATPGQAAALLTVTSMKAWIKYNASAYVLSTSTAGSGGPALIPSGISTTIQGYDQSRGDNTGNRPTLQVPSSGVTFGGNTYLFAGQGVARQTFVNLIADSNSIANSSGFNLIGAPGVAYNCTSKNANGTGTIGFNNGVPLSCSATNCLNGFNQPTSAEGCYVSTSVASAVGFTTPVNAIECIATAATGFSCGSSGGSIRRCVADSCNIGFNDTLRTSFIGCIASNCNTGSTPKGFVATFSTTMINCAVYNCSTNVSGSPGVNIGPFASGNTLTAIGADPYVSQATGDFRPNANNPGGAQIRGVEIGVFGQTNNVDIGAVQHSDPGSPYAPFPGLTIS